MINCKYFISEKRKNNRGNFEFLGLKKRKCRKLVPAHVKDIMNLTPKKTLKKKVSPTVVQVRKEIGSSAHHSYKYKYVGM